MKKSSNCIDCGDEVKRGISRCSSCRSRHMRANDYDADGFQVDVTTELPPDECGEPDYDKATHHVIDCNSREQAVWFAKKWLDRDKWGAVAITPYSVEDLLSTRPCPTHKVFGDTFYFPDESR